jgi:hypothetical protein
MKTLEGLVYLALIKEWSREYGSGTSYSAANQTLTALASVKTNIPWSKGVYLQGIVKIKTGP